MSKYDYYPPPDRGTSTGDFWFYMVMFIGMLIAGLVVIAHGEEQDRLRMRLSPEGILSQGKVLAVSCHVPKDTRNRHIEAGLVGEMLDRRSQQDLEGSAAPITTRFELKVAGCGPHEAYCAVYRTGDQDEYPSGGIVKMGFRVVGPLCE